MYSPIGKDDFADLEILNQPGRLVVNPLDLSQPFPFGGDHVGHALGGIDLRPISPVRALTTPDESPSPYSYIRSGLSEMLMYVTLQELNSVTVQLMFPGLAAVAPGDSDFRLRFPGPHNHGLMDGEAVSLLFVPDSDHTYAMLLRDALPFMEETERLVLGYEDPTEVMLVWRCRPKQGHNPPEESMMVMDRIANITIP